MTNKALQPFLHSKIEAIQNSQVMKQQIQSSKDNAKRVFKKRNPEANSFIRNKKLKAERDQMRVEILEKIETKTHLQLDPIKFKYK